MEELVNFVKLKRFKNCELDEDYALDEVGKVG